MGERFIRVGDIAFDIALAPVARVGPRKKAFFEDLRVSGSNQVLSASSAIAVFVAPGRSAVA